MITKMYIDSKFSNELSIKGLCGLFLFKSQSKTDKLLKEIGN